MSAEVVAAVAQAHRRERPGCSPPPRSVVELNRGVAIGLRDGPQAGLDVLTPLLADPALATYGYLSSARADFLRQLRQWRPAAAAYEEALTLTGNDVERAFLTERLTEVQTHLPI